MSSEELKIDETNRGVGREQLSVPPRLLLGPGPSNADPRVLQSLAMRQIGHLDPRFIELMNENQGLLRYAFQTQNQLTVPVSGCGSAAMEACFANLVEPDDVVLIMVAGYFAERMYDMADRYRAQIRRCEKPWGSHFTIQEIEAAVREHHPAILCLVHADTSTGCLQPMQGVKEICESNNCLLILDTVTSLGGCPLFVDKWGVDACYSGSQKNLSCPPGIAPLTLSAKAVQKITNRPGKIPNWYLDMSAVSKYWGSSRTYHHTAPINMNYALREALRIVAEEGLEARWKRHKENAELLYAELEAVGLECMIQDPKLRIPSLTTVKVPDGIDAKAVNAYLLKYNVEIGSGMGQLAGKVWRIGLMGFNSRPENVKLVCRLLAEAIREQRSNAAN